ncbi:MAG: hypothetical protein ACHQ53_16095 [Polyangiales bacterium]
MTLAHLRRFALCLACACAVLGALGLRVPSEARASVVLALGLEDLTRKADVIALVVATEQQSRMQPRSGLIVTDVSLRVEQALKGSKSGQTLVATLLGGKLDGVALQVPGEASLPIGQRVLVFLQRSKANGELRAVGMSQGVMTLSELGGATMVMPGGSGAALVQPGSDGALRDAPAALMQPQPLGALLDQIRALVSAQASP